jgi:NADH dehydrogenase (ubiquinone) 1 alpha subcomplex subunit 8
LWVEDSNISSSIPHVDEVGVTSAPMFSMSFAFGSACKTYTEDFMLCKNNSQDPKKCLKEGRKVTRCAINLIEKLKENCNQVWENHYKCLDMKNQMFEKCRTQEKAFNDCLFTKMVC